MKPHVVGSTTSNLEQGSPRAPRKLRILTFVLAGSAAAVFVGSTVFGVRGGVSAWTAAALLVLSVISSQRVAIFGDETAINSSIVVLAAAAATAAAGGPLWVPAICGVAAGLHWDHIRHRALRKLLVNASCMTLAVSSASLLGRTVVDVDKSAIAVVVLGSALTTIAYWAVNNGLLSLVLWSADGVSFRHQVFDLSRSETEMLPFAMLGFMAGFELLNHVGLWAMVLAVVGLLLASDRVVIQRLGSKSSRRLMGATALLALVTVALAVALYAAVQEAQPSVAALAALALEGALATVVLSTVCRSAARVVPVACGAAALVFFHNGHAAVGSLVVIMTAGVPLLFAKTSKRARRHVVTAAVIGGGTLVSATALLPAALVSSAGGAALTGAVAGCSYLLGWHAETLVQAFRTREIDKCVALDLVRSDWLAYCGFGLVGGLLGWIGQRYDLAIMAIAFAVVMSVWLVVARNRGRVARRRLDINDAEVLDVVRSAVLDLPASRVPDLQNGSRSRPTAPTRRNTAMPRVPPGR